MDPLDRECFYEALPEDSQRRIEDKLVMATEDMLLLIMADCDCCVKLSLLLSLDI